MASLTNLAGTVFQPSNVSENGFVPDTSQQATDGTVTITPDNYYFSDTDISLLESQTVDSVDLSTANSYRLGTAVVTTTVLSTGGSYPPVTFDIIGVNASQILLGEGHNDDGTWQSYVLLSNTDITEADGYMPPGLQFSLKNPGVYDTTNSPFSMLVGTTFKPTNVSENGFVPDTSQLQSNGIVTIPPGAYYYDDTDIFIADTQTVTAVDMSAANSYRLGTMTVVDTAASGKSYAPIVFDIIADNSGQILLGAEYNGNYTWNSYVMLANGDISTTDGYNPGTITLTTAENYSTIGQVPCFAAGTLVATPSGQRPVETLVAGDLVVTISGEARPITWAGHRHVNVSRHRAPELVRPVRIAAGAFGPGLPATDLTVSPDHNLFTGGVLIPAKCLVNGRNVVELDVARVTYHHIELATHDVVFANNMPAETYLDTGNRDNFAGQAATVAHPDFASAPDLNYFAWEAKGCAPLVLAGPELDAARAILAARADAATTVLAA